MIDVRTYRGGSARHHTDADISALVEAGEGLLWVDVVDPSADDIECLRVQFRLHPLAMEDVTKHHQRPKLEQYPTHAFVVAYSKGLQEVDFFIGDHWLVSVRERDDDGHVWEVAGARARFERLTPDVATAGFLLYVLLDELVDGYFDVSDAMEEVIEGIEDHVFAEDTAREERLVQQELFDVRRQLLVYRRAVNPLREVIAAMLRGEIATIDSAARVHLQDVHDHVLRVIDQLDSHRELTGNAVDAHLAIISNRMNQVMKRMTSWGAILLGATLVAGIYGMNFDHMPELHWQLGYLWALGLMAFITIAGYWWFRRKDWL